MRIRQSCSGQTAQGPVGNGLLSLQDKAAPADKQSKPEAAPATPAASAVSGSPEVLYINGNGTYSYHSYRGLGGGLLSLSDASSSGESLLQAMTLCPSEVVSSVNPREENEYFVKAIVRANLLNTRPFNTEHPSRHKDAPCSVAVSGSSSTAMQLEDCCSHTGNNSQPEN